MWDLDGAEYIDMSLMGIGTNTLFVFKFSPGVHFGRLSSEERTRKPLSFEDGISAPGNYVDITAEMDVIFVISSCPQINNPCNGFNPTPIRVMISDPPAL